MPSHESGTFECRRCTGFLYNSDFYFGLERLAFGSYRIDGGNPVFRISTPDSAKMLAGLKLSQFTWRNFWLYVTPPRADIDVPFDQLTSVTVTVSKSEGVWTIGEGEPAGTTLRVDAQPFRLTRVVCGNCSEIHVIAIEGKPLRFSLLPDNVYEIHGEDGGEFEIFKSDIAPPPRGPLAPAEAAGATYIVNGQTTPLRFNFQEGSGPEGTVGLLGREGEAFRCQPACSVEIRTGNSTISRALQPGKSYMIVFDTVQNIYDFRVYSQ